MKNHVNENINKEEFETLSFMKDAILEYYYSKYNWWLDEKALKDLHSSTNEKKWDIKISEQILKYKEEFNLTEEEIKKFEVIFTWNYSEKVIENWRYKVNILV